MIIQEKIRSSMNECFEKVGIEPIVEQMIQASLIRFGYEKRRLMAA